MFCENLRPGTNEPVEPGEDGEMVATSLFREAFPIFRFRTGDRVRRMASPCRCGRPMLSIQAGTVARYDDMMKIRGQNLWPDAVDKLVFAHDAVEEYAGLVFIDPQGRETAKLALEFRAACDWSTEQKMRHLAALADEIQAKLNVRMGIEEEAYLSLPRFEFKTRRWTDERRAGRSFVKYAT